MTNLDCHTNRIKSLDVSKNVELTELHCNNNPLASINISKNITLKVLRCHNTGIEAVNTSKNIELTEFYCYNNLLRGLDVSQNVKLKTLRCGGNQLENLNLHHNPALVSLYCRNNRLTNLDLTGNVALEHLECDSNRLTGIDISQSVRLKYLYCTDNRLTNLNVSANTALSVLHCSNNRLAGLNVAANMALTELYCNNNLLTELIAGDGTGTGQKHSNLYAFTDPGKNGVMALKKFYCNNNQLTELNIDKCVWLEFLYCNDNLLAGLDITLNTRLINLYCHHNRLTGLNTEKNKSLTRLYCNNNRITELDLYKNEELLELDCSGNSLTSLDIRMNPMLIEFSCADNPIENLDMRKNRYLLKISYGQKGSAKIPGTVFAPPEQKYAAVLQKADELRIQRKYPEALSWIQENITTYPKRSSGGTMSFNPIMELQERIKYLEKIMAESGYHERQADAVVLLAIGRAYSYCGSFTTAEKIYRKYYDTVLATVDRDNEDIYAYHLEKIKEEVGLGLPVDQIMEWSMEKPGAYILAWKKAHAENNEPKKRRLQEDMLLYLIRGNPEKARDHYRILKYDAIERNDKGRWSVEKTYPSSLDKIPDIIIKAEASGMIPFAARKETEAFKRFIVKDNHAFKAYREEYDIYLKNPEKFIAAVEPLINDFDGRQPYYVYALALLAKNYLKLGRMGKVKYYLSLAEKAETPDIGSGGDELVDAYEILSDAAYASANHIGAKRYALKATDAAQRAFGKYTWDYLESLNQSIKIYLATGEYARAASGLDELILIAETVMYNYNPSDRSREQSLRRYQQIYINAGIGFMELGDYYEAEYCLLTATNSGMLVNTFEYLGRLYMLTGKYGKAEKYLTLKLGTYAKEEKKQRAKALTNLAYFYFVTENDAEADNYFMQAGALYEEIGAGVEYLEYLGLFLSERKGEYIQAEKCFAAAKAIREKTLGRTHPAYAASLRNLGMVYRNMKNFTESSRCFAEAVTIDMEQVAGNFSYLSDRQRSVFWQTKQHDFDALYSLTYDAPVETSSRTAYDNTLFTKGLLLRTGAGVREAIYASDNGRLIADYDLMILLRQQISELQAEETPDIRKLQMLEIRADSLDKALTIASQAYKDLKADFSTHWQDVSAQLQPGEVAIEFVHFRYFDKKLTDSTLYCALILKKDSKAPVWIPLCEERQLQALVKRTGGIQEHTQGLYSGTNGDELYRLIWQPLEKELKGVRTVYYSPSGMLHQIALAALPTDHSVLSDKYDLQLVSSTREIARLKKEKPGMLPQRTAAVYGGLWYDADRDHLISEAKNPGIIIPSPQGDGPEFAIASVLPKDIKRGQSWKYLPGTEKEAKQICGYLKDWNISNRLYTEVAGNEESFKRLSGSSAGIIHLATHGFFLKDTIDDDRELMRSIGGQDQKAFANPLLRSGLLMAGANRAWTREGIIDDIQDGILTADEIAQMNLVKTRLVVLSACETGLGEVKSAEGVFGLQRAFKLAGVETLIMSLWAVNDEATSELMSAFYKLWLSGKTKREAFATAQRQVREKYKEPYHWAGFVMMD